MLNIHQLGQLDPRLRSVITSGETRSDCGALFVYYKIIAGAGPNRQAALWHHFEVKGNARIRHLVPLLHRTHDEVAAERINDDWRSQLLAAERDGRNTNFADGQSVDSQ